MSQEYLSEDICHHILSWAIHDFCVPISYGLMNKMAAYGNVFWVCGGCHQ